VRVRVRVRVRVLEREVAHARLRVLDRGDVLGRLVLVVGAARLEGGPLLGTRRARRRLGLGAAQLLVLHAVHRLRRHLAPRAARLRLLGRPALLAARRVAAVRARPAAVQASALLRLRADERVHLGRVRIRVRIRVR